MHYREIVFDSDISGINNPNVVRRELDELIRKRLIKEEGRKNWKLGKKLFYSLTEKGKQATINMVLDSLNEVLKTTERMLSVWSEPVRIEKWRKAARERVLKIKITSDMPLDKRISHVVEKMDKIYGPLAKNLWLMHQIIIKTTLPKSLWKMDVFVHVSEEGGVTLIPKALLKEKSVLRA